MGVFDGDGGKHFFQAMLDEDELGHKTTPGAFATNLSWYKNEMQRRHIEFVPDISCDSGGPPVRWRGATAQESKESDLHAVSNGAVNSYSAKKLVRVF